MKKLQFISFLLLCFCIVACKSGKEQATETKIDEFSSLITAYTGGYIPRSSYIVIELADKQKKYKKGDLLKEDIIQFSPPIKGKLQCSSENRFEFIPNDEELKRGTTYKANFKLGEIIQVDPKYKNFNFTFTVQQQDYWFKVKSVTVEPENKKMAKVSGKLGFKDAETLENAQKTLKVTRGKESFTARIEKENEQEYLFFIENIPIKEEETHLLIEGNSKLFKIEIEKKEEVLIPGTVFKLLSHRLSQEGEKCLNLFFSEPIARSQDLRGIIDVKGVKSYKLETENNLISIYYEEDPKSKEMVVSIDKNLKNSEGLSLKSSATVIESFKQIAPQLKFLSEKTILPSSNQLLIPFSAVNLYAVDLKIIKIYQNNILMFLQDNDLSERSYLRRSGRLIHKELIRLDSDATKNIQFWNNYSINLSKYLKQDPGAIYRVSLSANESYSAYPCDEELDAQKRQALAETISTKKMDLEDAIWDTPNSYYSTYGYYGYYNWEEREDPCKSAYYETNNCNISTNILASDIGIVVKANSENELWIAVNNLITTAPIANAELTVYNFQLQTLAETKSDKDGFARLELKGQPFLIVATYKGQKSYLKLTDGQENNLSRLDVGGKENSKGLKGFIYGERGIWRPGDSLHLSFMLNDETKKIPHNHPVKFELYNSRGQFYVQKTSTMGMNGIYRFSIGTQQDDPTGIWNAYVSLGGSSFHKALQIETIRPNRLKLELKLMNAEGFDASQKTSSIKLNSSWLTGAKSGDLKTDARIFLHRTHSPFKEYKKYKFNNPISEFYASPIELFEGQLDNKGEGIFTFNTPQAADAPGPLQANLVCNVYEPGGEANITTKTFPFSPYSSYVGINFGEDGESDFFETDTDLTFDLVTVNQKGEKTDNSLEYKIYAVKWSWWWENDSESFSSYVNNSSIEPVKEGKIETKNGKGKINFRIDYPNYGRYFVYVKNKNSGHSTGGAVYIDWPSWRGRSSKQDPSSLKILPFSLSKESYECGETVTAIIPQSSKGRALVSIENGVRVLLREWIELSEQGDTKYNFVASEDMAPNVYIHLTVLQPHEQTVNDLPIRMYGVMPVFINNKSSILNPLISMDDILRPEKEFTIKVKEKNNKAMSYTLAIVDEGLLDIVNFKTPSPWDFFYQREALGIKTWDGYDDVIGSFSGKFGSLLSIGGDEDIVDASKRKANRFKPVVKFMGPFELGSKKENSHKVTLPPYVGSVRVMVVAKQEEAYGNAEKAVPVRAPLMLLSSLPRVLSVDEKITLPVNVFAMENDVKKVKVKVESTGKIKISDKKTKTIEFKEPGDQLIFFDLTTENAVGVEKLTITATSNGHSSKEVIEIDIRNPNPTIIKRNAVLLSSQESTDLTYDLHGSDSNEDWIKLELSRIPSIDISKRFDYLYNYDHSCTEQLVSKAFPLLYIEQFKELSEKESEQIKKNVREAIAKLYGRQLTNGAFTYWPGYTDPYEWVSSYAGNFLLAAKEKGYEVNADALKRWKRYQTHTAQQWKPNKKDAKHYYNYDQSDLNQAYRLYTLALEGTAALGAMNRMKGVENLSEQAKWRLAAAYSLAGQKKAAEDIVFKASDDFKAYPASNSTYGSPVRDEAMLLETLILMGRIDDAFKIAQKIAKNLSVSSYTTQTTAYALIAMGRLSEKMSGNLSFEWTLNGKQQEKINSSKASLIKDLPLRPSKGKLSIKNSSKGSLHVNLLTKSKPLKDTMPSINNKISLEIQYYDLKGAAIDVSELKQGTDIIAKITLTNLSLSENYSDLLLNYIVPSGWEIFNDRMINDEANSSSKIFNYQDIRDDRIISYFNLGYKQKKVFEFRLMPSYCGSFTLPAVLCEAMYDTEVQARSKARKTVVIP